MKQEHTMLGVARLARMAFAGEDLSPLAEKLIQHIDEDPQDADALMDLSVIFRLLFKPHMADTVQARALEIRRHFHLPSPKGETAVRLLAIMAPGDLMANTPVDFLIEDAPVSLDMVYVESGAGLPESLPDHDVAFVAITDSDASEPILAKLGEQLRQWPRPVLNRPSCIELTTREAACSVLDNMAGVRIPAQCRVSRDQLVSVAAGIILLRELCPEVEDRFLIRPSYSHAGNGLERLPGGIDAAAAVHAYLQEHADREFYVAPFIDYSGPDGFFRKYRVVLIDGTPYASHMAISDHWMVHYLNAGMADSAEKRRQEERFMLNFDHEFAVRHADAFAQIYSRFRLDYLVIDCAEDRDGRLLVFEVDTGAVVHAMDPVDLFPYKQTQMKIVFDAFHRMLARRCENAPEQV